MRYIHDGLQFVRNFTTNHKMEGYHSGSQTRELLMFGNNGLTTSDVLEAFSDELARLQGTVADVFHEDGRLIARGVVPHLQDVQPDDRLQAGVAMRANDQGVWLHPYVFRLVCRNGAIMAQSARSKEIAEFYSLASDDAVAELRSAVRVCCEREAFSEAVKNIGASLHSPADLVLTLMPMLSRLPGGATGSFMRQIVERFFGESDKSSFGLMNAITSVARDTTDPEARWNLEELGGAIAIMAGDLKPRPRRPTGVRREREVLVG